MDASQDTPQRLRRVQRVRHELRMRELQVRRVEPLGEAFVRVVFGGDALEGFVSLGFDDHVKLILDGAPGGEPARRDYTPRHHDARRQELTLDFALHGEGAASDWARQAAVGQRVVIGGPRGSMVVALDHDWHLLAGDATAAPAIGRRLAELPEGARVIVIAQLDDLAPLELSASRAQVELHRVGSSDALIETLAGLELPPGEGYVWAAGEAHAMVRVRDLLLGPKAHPREAMRVSAYWKRGAADFHDDLVGGRGAA